MNKYCCIDLGNSRSKVAIYDHDGQLLHYDVRDRLLIRDLRKWKEQLLFNHVILSSTRIVRPALRRYLLDNYQYIELDHHTPIPIVNAYETPATLGRDRLAGAIGAWSRDTSATHLIIDAGTCITYDVVYEGRYIGGNIAPGIHMRLHAMHRQTDRLPLVAMEDTGRHLGSSTTTALQNGALLGAICEVESFIRRTSLIYGQLNVTFTGGDGAYLADRLDSVIFVAPNLVLEGLFTILRYNAK